MSSTDSISGNRIRDDNMDVFELIQIENRGMSVVTAIVISFYTVGFLYYASVLKREIKRITDDAMKQEVKIEKLKTDIGEMKTNIALTLQTVTRMEKILDKRRKD